VASDHLNFAPTSFTLGHNLLIALITVSYDGFGVKLQGQKLTGSFGKMQMTLKRIADRED
jgi:hypothetical protein